MRCDGPARGRISSDAETEELHPLAAALTARLKREPSDATEIEARLRLLAEVGPRGDLAAVQNSVQEVPAAPVVSARLEAGPNCRQPRGRLVRPILLHRRDGLFAARIRHAPARQEVIAGGPGVRVDVEGQMKTIHHPGQVTQGGPHLPLRNLCRGRAKRQ